MILYTADCLANVDQYDERNWGGNAYEYALALCLDAVLAIYGGAAPKGVFYEKASAQAGDDAQEPAAIRVELRRAPMIQ